MNPPDWILWMSAHFSPEQYLFWTRWQCLAWTLADLLMVYLLIRLSNLARSAVQHPPHRIAYALLGMTALLTPLVLFAPNGGMLFVIELGITVPHFFLLGYLLAANVRVYAAFLAALLV